MSPGKVNVYPPGQARVGDIVTGGDGYRWRVKCMNDDGSVLGLEPIGIFRRLYWWFRLRFWL